MSIQLPLRYQVTLRYEQHLGDPYCEGNPYGYAQAMQWDESDAFPTEAIEGLLAQGIQAHYVPKELGGEFVHAESFMCLGRYLARRNMSAAISLSTMLWSVVVWMGGTKQQKQELARAILDDAMFPCLAYSEATHGADLMANTLQAVADTDGYRLNGEKWPINRATTGTAVVLLARTTEHNTPRNHTLFVFPKTAISDGALYYLPRAKLFGLAGCDVSGIGFRDAKIPMESRIGEEGQGLEIALKAFQVTRTFCAALSLGVGDSLLRLAVEFTTQRKLYQQCAADLPYVRSGLTQCFISHLMAECTAISAARGLHLYPAQFSAWSSIAKVQCSELIDTNARTLTTLVGARSYLREEFANGVFQKFLRDGGIISIFDGSTPVCLDSLATLLPGMCKTRNTHVMEQEAVTRLFALEHELPPLDFSDFDMVNRGRDAVVDSLPCLQRMLSEPIYRAGLPHDTHTAICLSVERLRLSLEQLDEKIIAASKVRKGRNAAALFEYALTYCGIHAATACLGIWLCNRGDKENAQSTEFFAQGQWLLAVLERQGRCEARHDHIDPLAIDDLFAALVRKTVDKKMFSILDWPIG